MPHADKEDRYEELAKLGDTVFDRMRRLRFPQYQPSGKRTDDRRDSSRRSRPGDTKTQIMAIKVGVPAYLPRSTQLISGGNTMRPTNRVISKNPQAISVVLTTMYALTPSPCVMGSTTARMIKPITSSITPRRG